MIIGPALILILLLGVPVGVAFTLLVMVNAERWNIDWSVLPSITYDTVTVFPLLAIPLFLLGVQLMSHGGLIRQLTAVCDALIGRLQAHLGPGLHRGSLDHRAVHGLHRARDCHDAGLHDRARRARPPRAAGWQGKAGDSAFR